MNCFIQVDYMSPDVLLFVKQHEDIQGIVLGDYTCNRRMFSGGCAGLIKAICDFKEINKEIIIQTPLYLTERIIDETIESLSFLNDQYQVNKFLVQDVGVTTALSKIFNNAELIWSQMGRNRGNILNLETVLFLKEQGLTGMELASDSRIRELYNHEMKAYASFGSVMYKSVSRNCYNKYFNKDSMCRNDCCGHINKLSTKHGSDISIDGFFLGKEYRYNESNEYWQSVHNYCNDIIIHAENLDIALRYYIKYKEIVKGYE